MKKPHLSGQIQKKPYKPQFWHPANSAQSPWPANSSNITVFAGLRRKICNRNVSYWRKIVVPPHQRCTTLGEILQSLICLWHLAMKTHIQPPKSWEQRVCNSRYACSITFVSLQNYKAGYVNILTQWER